MKKADVEKLKVLMLRLHNKYPNISRVEVEHQQTCGTWRQKRCNCKPNIRPFEVFVK